MRATITTAIQIYGIWPLPRNFRVYAEFREIPRKYGNSAATAKFRGLARNSAARGKLWALQITTSVGKFDIFWRLHGQKYSLEFTKTHYFSF